MVSRRGRRAFAIPTGVIAEHLPGLLPAGRPGHAEDEPRPYPAGDAPLWRRLVEPVHRYLPDAPERADAALDLATRLGTPPPADGELAAPEWFALTALSAPHGVATLVAVLADRAPTREERTALQVQAVFLAPDELLTAPEHRELLALLAGHPAAPHRVAARALPLGPTPAQADWPELVRVLEGYRPRFGQVPYLLQVIEFAAREAADEGARTALQNWNDAVADRLDLVAALAGHRTRAAEAERIRRAREEAEAPLVQVQLWRSGGADLFGCTLRVHGADGSVLHRGFHDTPLSRSALLEVLAEVLAHATRESEPGTVPKVEFFVRKDDLDLDVDRWVYRPDDLFPSVLGQDFLVVLRCPELRRPEYRPELRYRWQARHTGRVLPQEERDPAVQERGRPAPVSGVALCCPPAGTGVLRAIALAVGVPGVVWPRPTADRRAGALLRELTAGLTVAQLPRAVYEARIRAGEGGVGQHLALVYDGPDGIPAALPLSDPQ